MKVDGAITNNNFNTTNQDNSVDKSSKNGENTSTVRTNGVIYAGELNIGSDVEKKRQDAHKMALNILKNTFSNDRKIDDEIESRNQHIDELNDNISEATEMISSINKQMDTVKAGYNIDDDSEEQKDLELLLKEKEVLKNSDITISDEEQERLDYIHSRGLTGYQTEMLELESHKGIYKKEINECKKEIISENAIVRGIHIERLKSHDMVDASKNADKVMQAANKEIIGMLIDDVKENIDNKFEEEQQKAEDRKEEKEALEKRIEEVKAEHNKSADRTDDLDEMYQLSSTLESVSNANQNSNTDNVKKSLTQVVNELNLTADDLKGIIIDKDV